MEHYIYIHFQYSLLPELRVAGFHSHILTFYFQTLYFFFSLRVILFTTVTEGVALTSTAWLCITAHSALWVATAYHSCLLVKAGLHTGQAIRSTPTQNPRREHANGKQKSPCSGIKSRFFLLWVDIAAVLLQTSVCFIKTEEPSAGKVIWNCQKRVFFSLFFQYMWQSLWWKSFWVEPIVNRNVAAVAYLLCTTF